MAFQFVAFFAVLAVASAGLIGAPVAPLAYSAGIATPTITSQSANILRSYGNLGQVSTYSKTIDTPYSSVRKSDVRVSNPGYSTYAAAPLAYAAAPVAHAYAAPVAHAAYAAPVARVAPAGLLGVAYSAAPVVSHMTYSNGLGLSYAW